MKMRQAFVALIAAAAVSCAGNRPESSSGRRDSSTGTPGTSPPAERHDGHGFIHPDQIEWKDGPPSLPRGAQFAVLEGDPAGDGFFAMRLKLPNGYEIPPHWHPNVERVTVISGTFHLGMGDQRSADAQALPAGSYSFMPPGMRHFAWAEGDTVVQIATLGPWAINYVNPSDDPRRKQ